MPHQGQNQKDKQRSNTTLNSYRSILSRLFTYAVKHKYIVGLNPFAAQVVLREQRQGCKPYSSKQKYLLKKAISETDKPLWLCVQLLYYCFIRPGEIRGLKIGDIDFDEAKILVRASISKNGKSDYVVIPNIFWVTLKNIGLDRLDTNLYVVGKDGIGSEEPFPVNWIGRRHGKILRSLGYDTGYGGHAFYTWKHTGVIDAVKAGINLRELQLQLRHHSLEEMQHYLRDLGINNAEQVRNMFPEL